MTTTSLKEEIGSSRFVPCKWPSQRELITHLCQYSQNILLLLAEKGGGKTTFTHYFSDDHIQAIRVARLDGKSITSVEQMMDLLAKGFHLNWPIKGQDKKASAREFEGQPDRSSTWVCVVDDADKMPASCLQALIKLIDFKLTPRRQLHLVLTGDTGLEEMLMSPNYTQIHQNKVHSIELSPWTAEDIAQFIKDGNHKIQKGQAEIANLYQITHGNPGQILSELQLSRQDAMTKQTSNTRTSNVSFLSKVISPPVRVGAIAGITLAVAFLYFGKDNQSSATFPLQTAEFDFESAESLAQVDKDIPAIDIAAAAQSFEQALNDAPDSFEEANTSRSAKKQSVQNEIQVVEKVAVRQVEKVKPKAVSKPKDVVKTAPNQSRVPVVAKKESKPNPALKVSKNESPVKMPENLNEKVKRGLALKEKNEKVAVVKAPNTAEKVAKPSEMQVSVKAPTTAPNEVNIKKTAKAVEKVAPGSSTSKQAKVTSNPEYIITASGEKLYPVATMSAPIVYEAAEEPVQQKAVKQNTAKTPVIEKQEVAAKVATASKTKKPTNYGSNSYTLQLLGSSSEAGVKRFIKQHGISSQAQYFHSKRNGKDWYTLVYGEYPNYTEAKEAASNIPSSLKKQKIKPWVRKIATLEDQSNK